MRLRSVKWVVPVVLAAVLVLGQATFSEAIQLRPGGQTGSDLRASIQATKAIRIRPGGVIQQVVSELRLTITGR